MTATWPSQRLREHMDFPAWGDKLRPVLRKAGPTAAAVFLMFNRAEPLQAFPPPVFSPRDRRDIVGFISFSGEAGDYGLAFDHKHHLLPLDVGSDRALMLGLFGNNPEALSSFVEAWRAEAAAYPICATVLRDLFVVYVTQEPAVSVAA